MNPRRVLQMEQMCLYGIEHFPEEDATMCLKVLDNILWYSKDAESFTTFAYSFLDAIGTRVRVALPSN